jgi:hypothetical protein
MKYMVEEASIGPEPETESLDAEQPVRTLIDERLDFKEPVGLRKSFIVASSYRSGSSFLCTSLWETGVLGAPWEYVNTDHELRNLMARFKVSNFADYLPKLLARRTSRNGVFGMKAHFHHFRSALDEYPRLLEDLKPVTFVYINRRDRVAQAVSMAKARQTKSWISLQRSLGSTPEYDKAFIDDALQTAARQTQAWQNWFKRRNITPFVVDYEDVVADKASVVRSIVELMGVQDDEPETIVLPPVSKQGDETNETWISQFKSQNETASVAVSRPQKMPAAQEQGSGELMDLAWMAYIYGFPCYELARLRYRALKNPFKGQPSTMNTWRHVKRLRTPETSIVTAANSDMLHSGAWLDLSRGPLVIGLPEQGARYYSVQLMDFFTNNFAVLGRGVADTGTREFLVAGPKWRGKAPSGTTLIRAPGNAAWALIRILVEDPRDLPAVYALQDQFTMSPYAKPARRGAPGFDPLAVPVLPLENTDPLRFFDVLNAVLTENPPPEQDRNILDRLKKIGVGPSLKFSRDAFTTAQLGALKEGLASARDTLRAQTRAWQPGRRHQPSDQHLAQMRGPTGSADDQSRGPQGRGWSRPFKEAGNFGTNYLLRARYALVSIGVLPREEAMYFRTVTDATGNRLDGQSRYILRFPPTGLPPADAFWSLTVYQADANKRRWLVPNEIDRYSIGDRTPGLRYEKDGSLEILVQHDRPTTNAENWLPVCEGKFSVTLRTYWPRRELLDERYTIPQIERR